MPNPHEHIDASLAAYLAGELSPEDRLSLEQHCESCARCQSVLAEAKKSSEIRWLGPEAAGRSRGVGKVLGFFWAAVAAAAVLLIAVTVYYERLKPAPFDLTVLGQSRWIPDSEAALHLRLVSRPDGTPLPGVPIDVELAGTRPGERVRLAQLRTSADGTARPHFRLPDWADGPYTLRLTARGGRVAKSVSEPVRLQRSWKLMLSTDKPVYQPGQVIRMRGLALRRPDLKPVAGREMAFSVTDPKGNVVFREKAVTSSFGIGAADCALAAEILEGAYQLECTVGDTSGRVSVDVKTYVLPKLKVDVVLDRPYYQPGQAIRGKIKAAYVHGEPVRHGNATVVLAAAAIGSEPIANEEVALEEDGTAEFTCRLPETLVGRPQDSGDARVSVTTTVRDDAGQSHARTLTRIVAAQAIRIEVVAEAGTLVAGVPNTIYVLTSLPDGRPVRARVRISGRVQELRTDALGVTSVEVTPQADRLAWTVEATDEQGHTGRREVTIDRGKPDDYLVRTERAVYQGGDSLHVIALGGGSEPVFLDLIRDGQTILTETIAMDRGRGETHLDLPPELAGTIELSASRYGPDGLPVHKRQALYVRPASKLAIRTTFDREEYKPGGRARLTVALTDGQGKPAPGAVSLAAVDEAIFGVLERRPGLEQTFFTLDEELLKPLYEIHDWSPDEPAEVPPAVRHRFEQALFARTARTSDIDTAAASIAANNGYAIEAVRGLIRHPEWEQLLQRIHAPAAYVETLRTAGGPHTLSVSTYVAELARVDARKRAAFRSIGGAWTLLVITAYGLLLATLVAIRRGELALVVIIVTVLIGLLLPATQAARESARRAQALSDLKQFATATGMVISADSDGDGQEPTSEDRSRTASPSPPPDGAAPARVRQWFPETLLWRPELVTDDRGQAEIQFDLADSITTWRLSASAVTARGQLGGSQASLRVFQPFFVDMNLPSVLTRGDEIAVPVVVSNYLGEAQKVSLTLDDAPWFERLDNAAVHLELKPGEVRSADFPIRVTAAGRQNLQVRAASADASDAVRRPVEVVYEGRRVERVASGTLAEGVEVPLDVPPSAIAGSVEAFVKLYPSSFGQLVEGLDNIFQRPYGCFEQTSSTTYPNVLALAYLSRVHKSVPAVEAKARQYIHLGYQRLVSFEVDGGGFDWFGHPPANRSLTAYGLMEFEDMAKVHDVDPALIERTRRWLLQQQRPDGSWAAESHGLEGGLGGGADRELGATAYIGWAVFSGHADGPQAAATLAYLNRQKPSTIDDPYTLGLVANALLALDPSGDAAAPYLDRLVSLRRTSEGGRLAWWELAGSRRSLFYGAGGAGAVETTALASLALVTSRRDPATARAALSWLISQKDAQGTWSSTQATVLALKALMAATGRPLGEGRPRRIAWAVDDEHGSEELIPADQSDVVRRIDLSKSIRGASHRLTLADRSGGDTGYQVVLAYHAPGEAGPTGEPDGPLSVRVVYDRTRLAVDERIDASATVTNNRTDPAPMVVVDLPIPAGFAMESDDLAAALKAGTLDKFQVTARAAVVYLRELRPGQPVTLRYRLRALMPVKVSVPGARVYEYYDPDRNAQSSPARISASRR